MGGQKKLVRERFRNAVFARDGHRCRACGRTSADWRRTNAAVISGDTYLDAHHITDRNLMPNGGYVPENGISLCPDCHQKAETWHATGNVVPGYAPDELYALIGSSHQEAVKASERLNVQH